MTERDIVHEDGDYWVLRTARGFEVYRARTTHSARIAVIGFPGDQGLLRAKHEIARSIEADDFTLRTAATASASAIAYPKPY